jgi:ADP-heptose:LPS heptosyltransferase
VKNFKKILVYRIGHLGDTLVSLPAFWAIRQAYPDAHITLLTNSNANNPNYVLAQNVLPKEGLFDDWLVYPTEIGKLETLLTFSKLFLEIRSKHFDSLFYLTTRNRRVEQVNRDVSFFSWAGIKNIIGTEYLLKNLLNTNVSRPLPFIETEKDFLLKCLINENLPIKEFENLKPDLRLTKHEVYEAEKWLQENSGNYLLKNKLLAVAPSGKWESKIWAEDSFFEVVQNLIEKEDVFPIIFGGSEDREKGERLVGQWGRGANAAGMLNIRQAAAALSRCRIYLGNDTGTMHLAASVGTPCVAVFSAIDWAGRWIPFGENHEIFRETVSCEGCLSCVCKFQHECLKAIKPYEVIRKCLLLWNKSLNQYSSQSTK